MRYDAANEGDRYGAARYFVLAVAWDPDKVDLRAALMVPKREMKSEPIAKFGNARALLDSHASMAGKD